MCRVSDGATGTRTAELKANEVVQYFNTADEAQARAVELKRKMNHAYSVAYFEYWPERVA